MELVSVWWFNCVEIFLGLWTMERFDFGYRLSSLLGGVFPEEVFPTGPFDFYGICG